MENEIEILSSAENVNVKVLVSFFLCESGRSAATQAIHKEKFNVPIDASHKDLLNFTKHVVAFTDLKQIASTKGLGQNPEVTIARVKTNQIGGVDVFKICKNICTACAENNQPSHSPCLRACDRCLQDGRKCERCVVLVLTTDCEEGNKKAMELIEEMQVNKTIDPSFEYLAFFPDSVHVGKSLKCSFCNRFIILNGERGSLSIIQTLRDDSNPVVRKKLRKLLKAEDVQNRDRMAVDPIIRLSSLEVLDTLKEVSTVVHQYRFSESNKVGMFPHPIAITCDQEGRFFSLDHNPRP